MQIIHSPEALHSVCAEWRRQGLKTALVPTMGYYHAGHASLISYARSVADKVIVSLFVNPTQFGPNEDLEAYPRDFEKDSALVRELGGDVLYAPEPENMYAPDHATWVEVPALANTLCGLSRPIHFRGVCTVVLKLFMLAQPSLAVFGEKDWQQLAIIKKMVSDLNVPVEVVGRPIVREADGLALSSRNVYLTPEERAQAPQIRKSLEMAAGLAAGIVAGIVGLLDIEVVEHPPRAVDIFFHLFPRAEDDRREELRQILAQILLPITVEPVLGIDRHDHDGRTAHPHQQQIHVDRVDAVGRTLHGRNARLVGSLARKDAVQRILVGGDRPRHGVGLEGIGDHPLRRFQLGGRLRLHPTFEDHVGIVTHALETTAQQQRGGGI